jgi:glutamate/aspartate transport system substrate-binding protein
MVYLRAILRNINGAADHETLLISVAELPTSFDLRNHMLPVLKLSIVSAMMLTLVPAWGDTGPSRLDKIRQTGELTIGYPLTTFPFAYRDAHQNPAGYTVEVCQEIAQYVKAALKMPRIDIRYNPDTSATRIPLLANGTIDLECGAATNNVSRHQFVSFAPTTFVAQVVLFARKDAGVDVNDPASFKGKVVSAEAGGQDFKRISEINAKQNLNMSIAPAQNAAELFLAVQTGRSAGGVEDDGIAYGLVASSRNPGGFIIGQKSLELAPYGILEPKDDPQFKKVVDDAVLDLIKRGRIAAIYNKYFNSPIPLSNINLNFPMSDALKRALAKPSDSGDPAAYQ